jgi:ribosome maturation factor RimP
VKAELAGGKKLKGSIQSVEEGGFLLASNQAGSSTGVAYEQVSQLKLPQVTCNSKGQPDAAEVKRLAAGLAVGHHIRVKTAEGKEYHGYIVALDAENFTMLPDDTTASVQLAYTDVVQLGPNLSKHTKTAVIVTVVVLAALLIFAAVRGPAS